MPRQQIGFAARRIIFGERSDILEQRRARRIIEPARRNRLLRFRKAGVNVGAKRQVDTGRVGIDLPQLANNTHV